jgi:hypothetical protein
MKQKHLIHQTEQHPVWIRNHWFFAVLIAFVVLIILGMVLFLLFPNRAV